MLVYVVPCELSFQPNMMFKSNEKFQNYWSIFSDIIPLKINGEKLLKYYLCVWNFVCF